MSTPTPSPARRTGRGALTRPAQLSWVGLLAAAATATVLAVSAPQPARARPAEAAGKHFLRAADPGRAATLRDVPDAVLSAAGERRLAASSSWGGTYTSSTGERVEIRASDSYAVDNSSNQRWADFLTTLLHGPEITTVIIYLAPLDEVQSICGRGAIACYGARHNLLVAPGEDVSSLPAESIVMHEYGHHVASNRVNPPWLAVASGTKRWATYLRVCTRTASGQFSPGDETVDYGLNPGEGFAEVYRVLNERRLGVPESTWSIVDRIFYPDETALGLVEQDVVDPWSGNTETTLRGSFARAGTSKRSFSTVTPYDGAAQITFRAPVRSTLSLGVFTPAGKRLASVTTRPGNERRTVSLTVCGARSLTLRVTRRRGTGSFGVAVSRP